MAIKNYCEYHHYNSIFFDVYTASLEG